MAIRSQRELEVILSRLKTFQNPQFMLEQYPTPANIAAEWIWNMALIGEAAGKVILDAGCGPGVLGLGLLLLGARKVFFLDKDPQAIKLCQENYRWLSAQYEIGTIELVQSDISLFDEAVEIVVQNPPFGTKLQHADRIFLETAFRSAPIVYTMHKYSTERFVAAMARDFGFKIIDVWRFSLPIKSTFSFHEKPVKAIDVGLWRLEKINSPSTAPTSQKNI